MISYSAEMSSRAAFVVMLLIVGENWSIQRGKCFPVDHMLIVYGCSREIASDMMPCLASSRSGTMNTVIRLCISASIGLITIRGSPA